MHPQVSEVHLACCEMFLAAVGRKPPSSCWQFTAVGLQEDLVKKLSGRDTTTNCSGEARNHIRVSDNTLWSGRVLKAVDASAAGWAVECYKERLIPCCLYIT